MEVHLVPEQRQPNPTDQEQRSCRSGECYKGNGSFDYIRAHILALLPTPLPESLPRQTYDRTVLGTIALRAIVPTGTGAGMGGKADGRCDGWRIAKDSMTPLYPFAGKEFLTTRH